MTSQVSLNPGRANILILLTSALGAGIISFALTGLSPGHRWHWWCTSPNDLGAIAAVVIALSPAVMSARSPRGLARAIGYGQLTVGAAALIGSRSRGALLAVIVALCLAASLRITRTRFLVVCAGCVLTGVMLSRAFHDRLTIDGSAVARFEVWRSTIAMIWDFPLTGVGTDGFPVVYRRWYELGTPAAYIWHPLNDFLYIAARWGMATGAFALAGVTSLCLLTISKRASSARDGYSVCAVCAFLTAGLTTTLFRAGGIPYIGIVLLAGLCWSAVRCRAPARLWARCAGIATMASVAVALIVLGIGSRAATTYAWRPSARGVETTVEPRDRQAVHHVGVISLPDATDEICRNVLRQLAAQGEAGMCIAGGTSSALLKPHPDVLLMFSDTPAAAAEAAMAANPHVTVCLLDPDDRLLGAVAKQHRLLVVCGKASSVGATSLPSAAVLLSLPVAHCWPRNLRSYVRELVMSIDHSLAPINSSGVE